MGYFDALSAQQQRDAAMAQFSLSAAYQQSAFGGDIFGSLGIGTHARDFQNAVQPCSGPNFDRPTVAYVSKVTPKPGYIVRGGLIEFGVVRWMRVEAKTKSDYKWWERVIIWFQT